jgi:hypothetical protein
VPRFFIGALLLLRSYMMREGFVMRTMSAVRMRPTVERCKAVCRKNKVAVGIGGAVELREELSADVFCT